MRDFSTLALRVSTLLIRYDLTVNLNHSNKNFNYASGQQNQNHQIIIIKTDPKKKRIKRYNITYTWFSFWKFVQPESPFSLTGRKKSGED